MKHVRTDVARELARFGEVTGLAPIVGAWPAAVGPDIARNAWPARIARDGTLSVHVASAAWAFELAQFEARIRVSLGDVAPPRIRFVVGPLPEAGPDPGAKCATKVESAPRHAARAAELTAQISDRNLREVVAKTAALSLAKAESDRSV